MSNHDITDLNTLAATSPPSLSDRIMVYPVQGFSPPGTPDSIADPLSDANPQRPTSLALIQQALNQQGIRAFTGLTDTPSALGNAGQILQVAENGRELEFVDAALGGGSVETGESIVSKLAALAGGARLSYNALRDTPTIPTRRTGAEVVTLLEGLTGNQRLNASAIQNLPQTQQGGGGLEQVSADATLTGLGTQTSPLSVASPFTAAEKLKLTGIATGAQVNVQADWDATDAASGAIRNKPTLVTAITALTDTPSSLSGQGGKFLAINAGGTAVEFVDEPSGIFTDAEKLKLSRIEERATADQTAAEIRNRLETLTGNNRLPADAIRGLTTGATVFTGLTDTPSALGTAGQVPTVNAAGNALEFGDVGGLTLGSLVYRGAPGPLGIPVTINTVLNRFYLCRISLADVVVQFFVFRTDPINSTIYRGRTTTARLDIGLITTSGQITVESDTTGSVAVWNLS